jgi:imidazolonepropionase-like amidohydrolase
MLIRTIALLLIAAPPASAQVQAFTNARIVPVVGAPIPRGTLVIDGPRIVAVGPDGSVNIPAGAVVTNLSGKVILPGLVDTHSHIADVEGADQSDPIQGDVRALDAINARSTNIQRARAGGITTVNVMPGSGYLMSGQTAYLKLRDATTLEGLLYCGDVLRDICGGLKMANGTNPRGAPPFPGTRAKAAALVRETFVKAVAYREKLRAAGKDSTKRPDRDLEMEALVQVLDSSRMVHHHTHRHDDILTVLRLQEEFGFRVTLHHVSEGWMVADEIAKAKVPSSIIVIDAPGGKLEAINLSFDTGKALEQAGALVAFHTDDSITDSRFFLRSAGLAVRAGMSEQKAIEGLTIAGARILDLEARVGSLEPGKDADFIVLSGPPLSATTHVEQTWVEGRKLFDRSNEADRAFATGGYQVFRDGSALHHDGLEGHD